MAVGRSRGGGKGTTLLACEALLLVVEAEVEVEAVRVTAILLLLLVRHGGLGVFDTIGGRMVSR